MKTKVFKRMKKASALLTALVICSIFSLFVVYYLSLIEQQGLLNSRSQTWNMAIAITEAGIEEGLENLNDNGSNLGQAPWSYLGGVTYYRSNSLPDGSSYTVFITNTAPNPVVVARAYVQQSTLVNVAQNISAAFFAAGGVSTGPTTVTRAVLVNCSKTSLFLAPLVAKKSINLNGNNISTDSYASCDPARSVNGQYVPGFYSGDRGDVASNQGLIDTISGGNANIYGVAHTGTNTSGQPTVNAGPNGAVGSHTWQASHTGLEPGWVLEDANFTFPDTTFPSSGGFLTSTGGVLIVSSNLVTSSYDTNLVALGATTTNYSTIYVTKDTYPAPGTYIGTPVKSGSKYNYYQITGILNFTHTLYSTNVVYSTNNYDNIFWGSQDGSTASYVANSLSGQTMVIGPNVVLALPNGLNMGGSDGFTIMPFANILGTPVTAPAGANVAVYSGGSSAKIDGNGVMNQPGYPADFIMYCAPTVTTFSLGGNGGFCGVLVAPTVDLTLNGGGSNPIDFIGCAMVNSAKLNGHFQFHYDECLANTLNNPRYLITAWNEIP